MSQASKQIKWCINKANKELEECKKLDKRPKHRGLLEVKPSDEVAKQHLEKALHNFSVVQTLEKNKFSDWTVNASFYTIYHCFLAIAAKFGYESRNQTCTVSLIEYLKEQGKISIDDKYIELLKYSDEEDSIIDLREEYTYNISTSTEQQTVKELIQDCKEIIDVTKQIIY